MAKTTDRQSKATINVETFHEPVEAIVPSTRRNIAGMEKKDLQALVQELQVENRELRVSQAELRQSRDRYAYLYDFASVGYITVDAQGRILEANRTAATMLGERQTLLRGNFSNFVARSGHDDWSKHLQAVFSSATAQSCELPIQSAGGGLFLHLESIALGNQPDRRCHIVLFDVTGRKQVEQALRESEERLVSALAAMTRLHQLVTRLLVSQDLSTALDELLDATITLTGSDTGTIQLLNPENNTLSIVAQRGFNEDSLERFRTVTNDDNSASRRAVKQRQRVIIEDIQTDPGYTSHRRTAARAGYRAVQSTPLMSSNRELLGVLSNHYPRPHRPSERDLRILDLYTRQAANFIERQRAEEALGESEQRFRSTFENAAIGMAQLGLDGRWLRVNDKLCQITGYSQGELLALRFQDIIYRDELQADLENLQQLLSGRLETYSTEMRYIHKEGMVLWASLTMSLVRAPQSNEPAYFICAILDISEHIHSEDQLRQAAQQLEQEVKSRNAELKIAHRQLRALTQRLHDLQEQERAQLARELHDEFGADLTAIKIDLHWLMKRLPQKANNLKQKARAMSGLIDKSVDSVRRMATLLRPRLLDDFGLVATIDWQLQDFENRTGIRVLAYLPEQIDLSKECSTAIFRILQEALTNVARHANATEIVVRLREESRKVLLQIKDNGVGISAKTVSNVNSFGLFGMRERAYAFGGVVRITRRRRQGTTVTVEIPIARRAQRHG